MPSNLIPSDGTILARILFAGTVGYLGTIALLRASGKRALSRTNAFDFVVAISLGATLADIVLVRVPLVVGLAGLGVLVGTQHAITWLTSRSDLGVRLVKAEPSLVFRSGRPLRRAMRRERITDHEVRAAARNAGYPSLDEVGAVVLEADGHLSVVARGEEETTLRDVRD